MASFAGVARWAGLASIALSAGFAGSCDDSASRSTARVVVGGKAFFLEVAADDDTRFRGLSERTHIEDDGGMIFVFPPHKTTVQKFVMRDCPVPIDIVYLDGAGRILAFYEMKPVAPRAADGSEGRPGPQSGRRTPENDKYEARLEQHSSRFPSPYVVELKGGTIAPLKLKEGDKVEFDIEGLKKRAR